MEEVATARCMLNDSEYSQLLSQSSVLGQAPPKLLETLRDQLKPTDRFVLAEMVAVPAGPALACLTETDLYLLWHQKLFFFFKFPAIQTFHRKHLGVERVGTSLQLKAQEEEATLDFSSSDRCQAFMNVVLSEEPQPTP